MMASDQTTSTEINNDIVLSDYLDDSGVEMKIHYEFCDNLVKYGINKEYVESFRDSFDFEKVKFLCFNLNML